MANRYWSVSFEELPSHLILEILSSGRLSAVDLVCLELTSRTFGASHGLYPHKFRSLVDFAAFQLCGSHPIYAALSLNAQKDLFDRCGENWKRVLRFLQSVEQSSYISETSADADYNWTISHIADQGFISVLLWFKFVWCSWSWS